MEFQKEYALPRHPNEHIHARWDKGFKSVQLFFRNRLIQEINDIEKIKEGFVFDDPELNKVKLSFTKRPQTLNVAVEGFDSISNLNHPFRDYSGSTRVMWGLSTIALIGFIFYLYTIVMLSEFTIPELMLITLALQGLTVGIYVNAAVLIRKILVWPFILAFSWFSLNYIATFFFTILNPNFISIFWLVFYSVFLVLLILRIPLATKVLRYKNHINRGTTHINPETLDNIQV